MQRERRPRKMAMPYASVSPAGHQRSLLPVCRSAAQMNGPWMARTVPFTAAQHEELQQQKLIYNHLMSGLPATPGPGLGLVLPGIESLAVGSGNKVESVRQSVRCRRVDGKKWRCANDAASGSKFCERHSRKPVKTLFVPQSQQPAASGSKSCDRRSRRPQLVPKSQPPAASGSKSCDRRSRRPELVPQSQPPAASGSKFCESRKRVKTLFIPQSQPPAASGSKFYEHRSRKPQLVPESQPPAASSSSATGPYLPSAVPRLTTATIGGNGFQTHSAIGGNNMSFSSSSALGSPQLHTGKHVGICKDLSLKLRYTAHGISYVADEQSQLITPLSSYPRLGADFLLGQNNTVKAERQQPLFFLGCGVDLRTMDSAKQEENQTPLTFFDESTLASFHPTVDLDTDEVLRLI